MTEGAKNPMVHAICGGVGAGKSTLAQQLKVKHSALLFTGDKWMARLFFPDMPGAPEFDWVWERIGRVEDQIWHEVEQAATLGISSVLDLGLTTAAHRQKFAGLSARSRIDFCLHWIDLSAAMRWQRVERRNEEHGETFAMHVSRENFDFVEQMWEPLSETELRAMHVKKYGEKDF